MQKFLVIYPQQPDLEAFKSYYVEKHVPLVGNLPGLLGYRYSFDVQAIAGEACVCIFEADFTDAPSMAAAMQSPAGCKLEQDVPNFAKVMPRIITFSVEG